MKNVLITGGSGLVGRELTFMLLEKGFRVAWLSREQDLSGKVPKFFWNYTKNEIDGEALKQADIIVHLAGENLAKGRWTPIKKEKIINSRVKTTQLLLDTLKKLNKKPESFISASAIGIYGNQTSETIFTENDIPTADDFLANVCREWEEASQRLADELNCRLVIFRTSMILSPHSKAFKKMYMPAKLGVGAPLGKGNQYLSWIHIQDLCNLYINAIQDEAQTGIYNAVAPEWITNREFMKTFSRIIHKKTLLPHIPSGLIRLVMGEAADMVLDGSRISSGKVQKTGFIYQYPQVDEAILNCVQTTRKSKFIKNNDNKNNL